MKNEKLHHSITQISSPVEISPPGPTELDDERFGERLPRPRSRELLIAFTIISRRKTDEHEPTRIHSSLPVCSWHIGLVNPAVL
jgi:hypothetical protein